MVTLGSDVASVLCLSHPPQFFSGCLFRDLTAERQKPTRPAAPRTSPVCFLRPPWSRERAHHPHSMRHSLCSRGEGPCHGADPRYWKHGRPSSFPGLQGCVSARGVSQGVGAWGAGMRPPLLIPRVVSQGCQPGVCAWGAGRDQLH